MGLGITGVLWLDVVLVAAAVYAVRWALSQRRVAAAGKVALVTGCDTGFGRAITERLAARGYKVLAACLTKDAVGELKTRKNVVPFVLDVTSEESMRAALPLIERETPLGLDVLLNNAGVLRAGLAELAPLSDVRLQLNVNTFGIFNVTKPLIPALIKAKGRVINIASAAGRFATPSLSAYNASKFAVIGLSDALRRELAPWGVQVVLIEPGVMKTPLWKVPLRPEAADQIWNSCTPEQQKRLGKPFLLAAQKASVDFIDKLAGDPKLVVDTLEHVATSYWPFPAYGVGIDAQLIFRPIAQMPYFVSDFVWRLLSPAKNKPAALAK